MKTKETVSVNNTDQWVDLYGDMLYRFALLRVGNEQMAEDLVQETFYSALKSQKTFRGESSVKTWLISILKRKIIDYYRTNIFKKSDEQSSENAVLPDFDLERKGPISWREGYEPQDLALNAEDELERQELLKTILKCIDGLPPKWAAVFRLREIDQRSSDEISKELEISASNIWVILHRARTELRRCLEKHWFRTK